MNKVILSSILILTLSSVTFAGSTKYKYHSNVKDILETSFNDNAFVELKGTVGKRVSFDKYEFSDETGSIIIDVNYNDDDNKQYQNQNIELKQGQKISFNGEVDNNVQGKEVEIKSQVEIIQ